MSPVAGAGIHASRFLQQFDVALDQLDLRKHMDGEAFGTGPRRSSALADLHRRTSTTDYMATNQVPVSPTGRRMFATYSKTKSERAVAGHGSRGLRGASSEAASALDIEHVLARLLDRGIGHSAG